MTTTQKRPGRRVQKHFTKPSMTQQNMRDECNINNIMERYQKTGVVEHLNTREPKYGDFTNVPDYQSALNMVIDAENLFMSIPAKIRKEFDNDPLKFVEFANNPENDQQLIEWGLKDAPKPSQETKQAEAIAKAIKNSEKPVTEQTGGKTTTNTKSKENDEK